MKSLFTIALLVFALSFCNLSERFKNRANNNRTVKTVQPSTAPGYGVHYGGKMEDIFPQKVLDYPLIVTINPRSFGVAVPEGTEVRGGVYRSRKNEVVKHMLVNFPTIEESARNLQIFLRKARENDKGLTTDPVRDSNGKQVGERFAFNDGEDNLMWTNGSLMVVVKAKVKDTVDKFAQALPYYSNMPGQ